MTWLFWACRSLAMSALPTIAKLLSTTSYHDEVPVYRTATTYIDAARQFHTRAFYDGHGNEIARLRRSHDSVPVLHSFNQYDGFGRLVRSYLPKTLNISRPGLLYSNSSSQQRPIPS